MKIFVSVKSNAKENKVIRIDNNNFKVMVKKPAINNEANKEVVKLLAKHFKKTLSEINIVSGHKNQNKIINID